MVVKTYPWDMADSIETYEDVDIYLRVAYEEEDEDPGLVDYVLDAIARSKAMSKLTSAWAAADGPIEEYIREEATKTLEAYRNPPSLIGEQTNMEKYAARVGYAECQLLELVQNGAVALSGIDGGRIWVRLAPTYLYCADEGEPIDIWGMKALVFSRMSPELGILENRRSGLRFESILEVTDAPELFSQSGSFRFDRERASSRAKRIAPTAKQSPVLHIPESMDPIREAALDPILRELMEYANNIVRLPLKAGAYDFLAKQIADFPPEFLSSVKGVGRLELRTDDPGMTRVLTRDQAGAVHGNGMALS